MPQFSVKIEYDGQLALTDFTGFLQALERTYQEYFSQNQKRIGLEFDGVVPSLAINEIKQGSIEIILGVIADNHDLIIE